MLSRGAVKVDGQVVDGSFALEQGQTVVIQAGKKRMPESGFNQPKYNKGG